MDRREIMRCVLSIAYTLGITFMIGTWAVRYAYLERGYIAVGGEYGFIFAAAWIAWLLINYFFDIWEELGMSEIVRKKFKGKKKIRLNKF